MDGPKENPEQFSLTSDSEEWDSLPKLIDDPDALAFPAQPGSPAGQPSGARRESDIKVMPRSGNEIPYPNCLLIDPRENPNDSSALLATVDHFLAEESENGLPWTIRTLNEDPVPFQVAMDMALTYAEENGIPVVLVNQDGMSTESEKRQTDTTILGVGYHHKITGQGGDGA